MSQLVDALQHVEISARRATFLIDHLRVQNEQLRARIALLEAERPPEQVYELLTGFDEDPR